MVKKRRIKGVVVEGKLSFQKLEGKRKRRKKREKSANKEWEKSLSHNSAQRLFLQHCPRQTVEFLHSWEKRCVAAQCLLDWKPADEPWNSVVPEDATKEHSILFTCNSFAVFLWCVFARCSSSCLLSLPPQQDGEETRWKRLESWDWGGDIAFQWPSWAEQPQLAENGCCLLPVKNKWWETETKMLRGALEWTAKLMFLPGIFTIRPVRA